ncbi:hypothetical protein [Saccharospirillum salsuginis]|uniref:Uncharacterized protein n=1 Tax=Saccharospirillum salsuginis TaxID=418750 RepID=A0A918NF35_9GAMM|nr:hypothetical protein [Saccharospirillum salsuginis]GGX63193.1 hypothetical protein GCM10007392_33860 [Saccharospirillum salsuginis]
MKRIWIGSGLAALTAVSIGWYGLDANTNDAPPASHTPPTSLRSSPESALSTQGSDSTSSTQTQNQRAFLAYEEYRRLFRVSDAVREYLDTRDALTPSEQDYREVELRRQLNQLEAENKLSAGEALALRLALIERDDAQAKADGLALIERYDRERKARLAAFRANPDPEFQNYKTREAEIVREVMAMEHYPDGLTRNEYLARRLAEARQAAYR